MNNPKKYHIESREVVGVGKPNHGVCVKLLVREKPSIELTSEQEKGVQDIGSDS